MRLSAFFNIFSDSRILQLFNKSLFLFFLLYFVFLSIQAYHQQKKVFFPFAKELLVWSLSSFILFAFLHFNQWYLLALSPLFVSWVASCLRQSKKFLYWSFLALLFFTSLSKVLYFSGVEQSRLLQRRDLLPVKLLTIARIRELAGDQAFNSYQYAPHIYDYDWQYLYFYQAIQGKSLPKEFTYQPGEDNYLVQKADLLKYFSQQGDELKADSPAAVQSFYIVEKAYNQNYLQEWWQHLGISEPGGLEKEAISSEVTLYYVKK